MTRMEFLELLIKARGYKDIAEVGLNYCHTARHLLKTCQINSYFGVDMVETADTKEIGAYPNVTFVKGDSADVGNAMDKTFDVVFIDADHRYDAVINDIKAWEGKVRPGGILCGDDCGNPLWPDVKKAVQDYFAEKPNTTLDMIGEPTYFWWVERK